MNVTRRCRSYFLRGLAVLLPTMLTIWILAWGFNFVQENVTVHINRGLVKGITWAWAQQHKDISNADAAIETYEGELTEKFANGFAGSIVGLLIALAIVFLVGALLASVAGRVLWRGVESIILGVPILRRVYPYVKQLTDFILTQEEQQKVFSKVVAVEYPHEGMWAVGFVTGSGLRRICDGTDQEWLTVLVSTSPTPITGPVVIVPKDETIALDMTIEEAFRFVISGGVVIPDGQHPLALPATSVVLEQEKC